MQIDAFSELIDRWRVETDTPLMPPVSDAEIRRVFRCLGHAPTADVCQLFSLTGGMPKNCSDDRMLELWCLDRIAEENAESPWEFLWFADWLIASHLYALRPVSPTTSAVYIDHQCDRKTAPERVADSLQDFVSKLVHDPESVYCFL
jgi:hypothetical protein